MSETKYIAEITYQVVEGWDTVLASSDAWPTKEQATEALIDKEIFMVAQHLIGLDDFKESVLENEIDNSYLDGDIQEAYEDADIPFHDGFVELVDGLKQWIRGKERSFDHPLEFRTCKIEVH